MAYEYLLCPSANVGWYNYYATLLHCCQRRIKYFVPFHIYTPYIVPVETDGALAYKEYTVFLYLLRSICAYVCVQNKFSVGFVKNELVEAIKSCNHVVCALRLDDIRTLHYGTTHTEHTQPFTQHKHIQKDAKRELWWHGAMPMTAINQRFIEFQLLFWCHVQHHRCSSKILHARREWEIVLPT